jgi:nitroreductase
MLARDPELVPWVGELIHSRSNISPKRLVEPGPDATQLQWILEAACAAPDHGRLRPWRLVLVPTDKRPLLAQAFEAALRERDAQASAEQMEMAREKAFRAPVLVLAIACLSTSGTALAAQETGTGTPVHDNERLLTLGCAIQNVLLSAHALGFGSGLTSGQAMHSQALRALLALEPQEQAVCCINLGTVTRHKPQAPRAALGASLRTL